jgi:Ca2+-binding EF-hand superfamily protein
MTPFVKASTVALTGLFILSLGSLVAAEEFDGPGMRPGGMRMNMLHTMISDMDLNKDGTVTRAEAESHAVSQFKKTDTDKNGAVTPEEIKDSMRDRMKARHDPNKDGKISKEEFLGHPAKRFDKLDTNKDGTLSKSEFLAGPEKIFACLDKNKDGFLSEDERPQGQGKGRHGGNRQKDGDDRKEGSRGKNHFAAADTDGNGSLSEKESVDAALKRFDRADKNGDGKITKEEMAPKREC